MTQVILTTTTFYRDPFGNDEIRFDLAKELVELAKQANHEIVIVDGSPNDEVAKILQGLGAIVTKQEKGGMGASRRQAWEKAREYLKSNSSGTLWTEPEKPDIVRFIPEMASHIQEENAAVLIPSRSTKSWETYPAFQRESEPIANFTYNKLFPNKNPLDPMFGPVLFRPNQIDFMIGFRPEAWGLPDTYVQHYLPPFIRARKQKVASLIVDFQYPPAQKAEEEGPKAGEMFAKRLAQLGELIKSYWIIKGHCPQ